MQISRMRLEYATEAFLAGLASAQAARNTANPIPPKTLSDYSPEDAAALMASVKRAIIAASPVADDKFETWSERRNTPATPN